MRHYVPSHCQCYTAIHHHHLSSTIFCHHPESQSSLIFYRLHSSSLIIPHLSSSSSTIIHDVISCSIMAIIRMTVILHQIMFFFLHLLFKPLVFVQRFLGLKLWNSHAIRYIDSTSPAKLSLYYLQPLQS